MKLARNPVVKGALVASLLAAPAAAHAQFAQRFTVSLHGGAGALLSDPHAGTTAVGGGGGLRLGLRLFGPLHLHALADLEGWPTRGALGSTIPLVGIGRVGGGVRIHPVLSERGGGPFVDVDAAATLTTLPTRLSVGFGAGWLIPLGSVLAFGPVVRAGIVLAPANDPAGLGSFWYGTAGLELVFRVPPPRPAVVAPPPPPPPPPPVAPAPTPVDPDPDHDGVLGAADRCPTEPETRNAFEEEDGCPDNPDADGDGVLLPTDRCPNEPETANSYEDDDGCPDNPDADGDGVLLPADRCPEQPETRNEFEDADGCPDTPPPVQLAGERITVNGTILFQTDRDRILPESFGLLDQVAAILQGHSEIRRIRIEGHTDNQGRARRNRTLSRRRAASVERYLREHGIDRARLTSEGFGADRLLATGTTPEDHARNRRVEFYIVDPPGGVSATAAAAAAQPATPAPAEPSGRHGRHGRREGRHRRR